jgi:hypothetical protein
MATDTAKLDAAWMSAGRWHSAMVSTRNRLMRMGKARIAREKRQPLYCWYGPQLPEYKVVHGRGPYPPPPQRRNVAIQSSALLWIGQDRTVIAGSAFGAAAA